MKMLPKCQESSIYHYLNSHTLQHNLHKHNFQYTLKQLIPTLKMDFTQIEKVKKQNIKQKNIAWWYDVTDFLQNYTQMKNNR